MSLSRRDFFKKMIPNPIQRVGVSESQKSQDVVVFLGHMNDFCENETQDFIFNQESYTFYSKPYGLYLVQNKNNKKIELLFKKNGEIYADLSKFWKENAVLSLMTGEIYYL